MLTAGSSEEAGERGAALPLASPHADPGGGRLCRQQRGLVTHLSNSVAVLKHNTDKSSLDKLHSGHKLPWCSLWLPDHPAAKLTVPVPTHQACACALWVPCIASRTGAGQLCPAGSIFAPGWCAQPCTKPADSQLSLPRSRKKIHGDCSPSKFMTTLSCYFWAQFCRQRTTLTRSSLQPHGAGTRLVYAVVPEVSGEVPPRPCCASKTPWETPGDSRLPPSLLLLSSWQAGTMSVRVPLHKPCEAEQRTFDI